MSGKRVAGAAGAFALSVMAMLWPAIENGYPLAMVDTARHLGMRYVHPIFPYGYNLWLFPLQVLNLPWIVVAAQAAIVVGMTWLALRRVAGERSLQVRILLAGALAALTSGPFVTSMLLPDFFTPIGLLAITLAPWARGKKLQLGLGALVSWAAVSHYSHAPLFAAVLTAQAALLWRLHRPSLVRLTIPGCAIAAACIILAAANWVCFDRFTYSIAGPTFVLARLQADGPATAYLRERCPDGELQLCSQLDRMPMPHSEFLWTDASPVEQLGGFAELSDESAALVRGTVLSRPGETIQAIAGNALRQLKSFVLFPDASGLASPWFWERAALHPPFEQGVRSSKQFTIGFRNPRLGRLQKGAVLAAALLLLPLCLLCARGGVIAPVVFALTLSAGVAVNALLTGGLSAPDPRYGARVAWLLPLATGILAVAWHRRRRPQG